MTRDLSPPSCFGLAGFDCPSHRCFLSVSPPSSFPSAQPTSALAAFWRKGHRKWKVYRRNTGFSPGKKTRLRFLLLSVVTEESCWEFLGLLMVGEENVFAPWYPHSSHSPESPHVSWCPAGLSWVQDLCKSPLATLPALWKVLRCFTCSMKWHGRKGKDMYVCMQDRQIYLGRKENEECKAEPYLEFVGLSAKVLKGASFGLILS